MAKKIVITSGKGGVGKTTVTANLGCALADVGQRVLLIDLDFGLNNLDVVLGLENKILYDIQDVLLGRCRIKQALIQDRYKKNLFFLSSGKVSSDNVINGQNIKLILENINSIFDYIIIDCPAGIDCGFHRAISCADQAIVVATPSFSSLRDADKVIHILKAYKIDEINLIVNRVRGDLILNNRMMYPKDIQELLKTKLIGVLPEEDVVFLSAGEILPKKSDSYKAYKLIANNLTKGSDKLFDVTKKYTGFIGSIKRGLKSL
ncbi:MAG: septum site-determining protein MinD [Clostridia bacterium]|nr:septum site-determining protein MinD [Clostridia bacterium]